MIDLRDVAYHYGGAALFSGISLTLSPGSFHFLTGPTGVGKTTLLRLCHASLSASAGTVTLFGTDAQSLSRDEIARIRRRIGIVHQDCQFIDHLSVAENIALPLTVAGRFDVVDDLTDLLKWVDLAKQAGQRPTELSGGERQRAALARAVIQSPDVILADEPTGNVDAAMAERMLALLTDLNKSGKTILIATHDMHLIRMAKSQVQARVLRLKDGQLIQAGADL